MWDSLLTKDEKDFLKEWSCTIDMTKLCPEDVKRIVQILQEKEDINHAD